jgi:hypothetical protein
MWDRPMRRNLESCKQGLALIDPLVWQLGQHKTALEYSAGSGSSVKDTDSPNEKVRPGRDAVVDFVTVKAPKSHKDQQESGARR